MFYIIKRDFGLGCTYLSAAQNMTTTSLTTWLSGLGDGRRENLTHPWALCFEQMRNARKIKALLDVFPSLSQVSQLQSYIHHICLSPPWYKQVLPKNKKLKMNGTLRKSQIYNLVSFISDKPIKYLIKCIFLAL